MIKNLFLKANNIVSWLVNILALLAILFSVFIAGIVVGL
jgi:hypothetical protein